MKKFLARIIPKKLLIWHRPNNQRRQYEQNKRLEPSEYPAELAHWLKETTDEDLDLEHPTTFNQKMQWMKLYDSTPEKGRLADKYLMREYVAGCIGEQYLLPLLGVWDDPDDIDFGALPDRFVLKCTHGCGWSIVARNKAQLDILATRRKLREWFAIDWAYADGLELHHHYCEPRVVAEAYLENMVGRQLSDLFDYKFWCFGGRAEYAMLLKNR